MRRRNRELVGILLASIFSVAAIGLGALAGSSCACSNGKCYEDVIVTGAGYSDANGTYHFEKMLDGYPWYVKRSGSGLLIAHLHGCSAGSWHLAVRGVGPAYRNDSDLYADTPPRSGWQLHPGCSGAVPTMRGGGACSSRELPITIVPTGDAGPEAFLDTVIEVPEDEDPPMAGELPLVATHAVGDVITGSCQVLYEPGNPIGGSFVHIYVYSVDIDATPEVLELLNHWMAPYSVTEREYQIAWETEDFAPGYYDLVLFFEDASTVTLRIELT